MKFKNQSAFVIAFMAIMIVTSFASAAVVNLYPQSGSFDNSSGTVYSLTSGDLIAASFSDDSWYENQGAWPSALSNTDYLQFNFSNSLTDSYSAPSFAIEYKFSNYNSQNLVQLSYYTSSGWSAWQNITMPTGSNSDVWAYVPISISSQSDLNNLQVKIRAKDNNALRLSFDSFSFNYSNDTIVSCTPNLQNTSFSAWSNLTACLANNTVQQVRSLTQYDANNCGSISNTTFNQYQEAQCTYDPGQQTCTSFTYSDWSECVDSEQTRTVVSASPENCVAGEPVLTQSCEVVDTNLPTCSIDYVRVIGTSTIYNISQSPYINFAGNLFVYGSAQANEGCYLSHVGYNRTSPNFVYESWRNADNQGLWSKWRTSQDDVSFVEGNHTVCCQVESRTCAGPECDQYSNTECKTFCIDLQDPVVTSVSDNTADCSADGRYTNSSSVRWDWSAYDNGCAGLKNYTVTLMFANGSIVNTTTTTDSFIVFNNLIDAESYKISVKAYDNAGNDGNTVVSQNVIIDLTNPQVDITGPTNGWIYNENQWFGADFNVSETDVDTNLLTCYYRVQRLDSEAGSWVALPCGSNFTVDVNAYFAEGQVGMLVVEKMANDKACRVGNDFEYYMIDLEKPNTTKTVWTPKFAPWGSWIETLVNGWFVTSETDFTFESTDFDGSGISATYYNVTFNGTTTGPLTYGELFNLPNVDGLYTITYWAIDNVGNVEVAKYEVDKLDNLAPITNKTYGFNLFGWRTISEFNNLKTWMRFITPETNITLGAVDTQVGVNTTYFQILVPSSEETKHAEWYGNTTAYWYESLDACVEAGNAENKCTMTYWSVENDAVTSYGEMNCDGDWCVYDGPITVEESEHKICYYSTDHLGNTEDVKCQVFSVDGIGPNTYIINPDAEYAGGNLATACVMPLDVKISDVKVGVSHTAGDVYAIITDSQNANVWEGNLVYAYNLPNGEEGWYYPNGADLTGLPAGTYTLNVYAKDRLGNVNPITTQEFTLDAGIFVPANWIDGCDLGKDGGVCTLQFTACARGVTDMNFSMTKLMDQDGESAIELASILQLQPTLITQAGQGMVGYLHQNGWPGDVVSLNNSLSCGQTVNDRIKFNVTLNLSSGLIENIGTGTYHFDWEIDSFADECLN